MHGFPHARAISRTVEPLLAASRDRVIVPDRRGLGDRSRTKSGYRAIDLATVLARLFETFDEPTADVVGIILGVAPAFGLAALKPDMVRSLALNEAVIGGLPGAEEFFGVTRRRGFACT